MTSSFKISTNLDILNKISSSYKGFSVQSLLFRNETIEWVGVCNWKQSLKNNTAPVVIYLMSLLLFVVAVVEPSFIGLPWNAKMALLVVPIIFLPLAIFVHSRKIIFLVTNYRAIIIHLHWKSCTVAYAPFLNMEKINQYDGGSIEFVLRQGDDTIPRRNSTNIFFRGIEDPSLVRLLCMSLMSKLHMPLPSTLLTLPSSQTQEMIPESHSALIDRYLIESHESVLWLKDAPKFELYLPPFFIVLSTLCAFLWMFGFLVIDIPNMFLYATICVVPIFPIMFFWSLALLGTIHRSSVLTDSGVLLLGTGLNPATTERTVSSCFSFLTPRTFDEFLGRTLSEHKFNSAKGTIFVNGLSFLPIMADDIRSVEEFMFCRAFETAYTRSAASNKLLSVV
eukprot:TRINITY_DN5450_c0_g1_i5.p1 TRINITY_DN5450_c0_g1~~TRINITY_DN5450_c0_g1_i5.p1  ORF type:complete len:394 (+),score=66.24 TRINITY_DN5450_c0_g1_i5:71-1252(+)